MPRLKIDRLQSLKEFVNTLRETYPTDSVFNRRQVEFVGLDNKIGMMAFTSESMGYGKMTRIGRGDYIVPIDWVRGNAPWDVEERPAQRAEPRRSHPNAAPSLSESKPTPVVEHREDRKVRKAG